MGLQAIFYARFHPERGPSVIHQYPSDSIIISKSSGKKGLFKFSDLSSFIIPPYELCNRPLSICSNGYRILGFPVSLEDAKYARNRFTFNLCFVIDERDDTRAWEQVVRKTAAFFRAMEQEDGILQAEEDLQTLNWAGEEGYPEHGVGVLYTLLETIFEQLNAYSETCARISDYHVLNLRPATPKPAAPKVHAWDVPLLIRPLPSQDEWTWDLTLRRIHPHIDGVKHVQRIAELADVDTKLFKKAIRELLYHERVLLLDIFHFQAVYALTESFALFVQNEEMLENCSRYIALDHTKNIFASTTRTPTPLNSQTLITLYKSLNPGTPLHDFCLAHETQLTNIDIRRLITYGILKGFLRRVHKYALAISPTTSPVKLSNGSTSGSHSKSQENADRDFDRAWKRAAFSSGWATPPPSPPPVTESMAGEGAQGLEKIDEAAVSSSEDDERLRKLLDGAHCMDEICVAMRMSEKKVVEKLRSGRFGEVLFFCK